MNTQLQNTTRVFYNGNSQAVRIPKEYQFDCKQVQIKKEGDSIILTPVCQSSWVDFFEQEGNAPDDFMDFNRNELPQDRDIF